MKKTLALLLLLAILFAPSLFADDTKHDERQNIFSKTKRLFTFQNSDFSLGKNFLDSKNSFGPRSDLSLDASERLESRSQNFISEFKLAKAPSGFFYFSHIPRTVKIQKRDYLSAGLETLGVNVSVWLYDKYILRADWADISINSIINNIKQGFYWDSNSFLCNQFEHPFHGAMFFTAARINGFSFWESTVFPFLGSTLWELALENNKPSTNDNIVTPLGGILLGEALLRTAELIIDENSKGFERAVREVASFIVNPVHGLDRLMKRREGKDLRAEHDYNFSIPLGCSISLDAKPSLMIAADLDYEDALRKNSSGIRPYDYFTLDFKLGLYQRYGFRDKEFSVRGILAGRRLDFSPSSKGLEGLFGQFDYVDTAVGGMISSIGAGYGLMAKFDFDSDYFLRTNGILALMIGGCSSSLALEYGDGIFRKYGEVFQLEGSKPYYLGPGLSAKMAMEFGKRGMGSVGFSFRKYWIYSIFATNAAERISNLMLRMKYEITASSQVSVEYDWYLRDSTYRREYAIFKNKSSLKVFYIFKF